MPDPTPSSAPTQPTTGTAAPTDAGTGSAANGGAVPGGGVEGAGTTPDGAAPGGGQAGGGVQSPASSPEATKAALELKAPPGWKDETATAQWKKAAEELGLDAGKAQPLFDLFTSRETAEADALAKAQAEWLQTAKADKEIGGASFEANTLLAKKAMVKFGGESLQAWLQETGLGNHPELIRAFVRIGKAMAEDSIGGIGGATNGAANSEMAKLRKLYPNSPEMFEG